jgi:hypothetical protein
MGSKCKEVVEEKRIGQGKIAECGTGRNKIEEKERE